MKKFSIRSRCGKHKEKKFIYTHRGNKEHIQECLSTKCIKVNYSNEGFSGNVLLDHNKACVWVSKGYPTKLNYLFSGMIEYQIKKDEPRKYYITFLSKYKAKSPSGWFKKLFRRAQRVFENDILLNDEDILDYDDGR